MVKRIKNNDKHEIGIASIGLSIIFMLIFLSGIYKVANCFIPHDLASVKTEEESSVIEQAAWFGDLVGGFMGTIIGAVGTGFLIYTFYQQQLNFRKERFESRFFELMKVYRESVLEMNIGDKVLGRKSFMLMFKEFKFIYYIAKITLQEKQGIYTDELKHIYPGYFDGANNNIPKLLDDKISDISFEIFFFGIGLDSEKVFKSHLLTSTQFYKTLKKTLEDYQQIFLWSKDELKCLSTLNIYHEGESSLKEKGLFFEFETKYYPFDGHISRLGHYYRQLFQIVRYVVLQEDDLLNKDEVLEHLKILRTQMSNHEQLLLYYNGMCGIGLKWRGDDKNNDKDYFKEYQMIHNLPIPLADVGHLPDNEYTKNEIEEYDIFEWY